MSATVTPTCPLGLLPDDLSAWRDSALSADETQRLNAHVYACPACLRTISAHEALAAGLHDEQEPAPGPRNWSRVRARMTTGHTSARTRLPARAAIWSGVGAVAAAAILVALFASAFGNLVIGRLSQATATATPPGPAIAPQPRDTTLPLVTYGYLGSVSFSSARDGWAAGGVTLFEPAPQQAVLIHYHNGIWTRAGDNLLDLTVGSISMVSASDGWAVARPSSAQNAPTNHSAGPVLLHFSGDVSGQVHWRVVSVPALAGFRPTTVYMFSADSGYITGSYPVTDPANGPKAVTEYMAVAIYQHASWLLIKTPFPLDSDSSANALTMVSPSEGWASVRSTVTSVSGQSLPQTILYHYAKRRLERDAIQPGGRCHVADSGQP